MATCGPAASPGGHSCRSRWNAELRSWTATRHCRSRHLRSVAFVGSCPTARTPSAGRQGSKSFSHFSTPLGAFAAQERHHREERSARISQRVIERLPVVAVLAIVVGDDVLEMMRFLQFPVGATGAAFDLLQVLE